MNIYLQGLTMGLAYVAPIGLQNLFVINTALTQKRSRVYLAALIVICTVSLAATFAVTVWTVRLTSRLLERGKQR